MKVCLHQAVRCVLVAFSLFRYGCELRRVVVCVLLANCCCCYCYRCGWYCHVVAARNTNRLGCFFNASLFAVRVNSVLSIDVTIYFRCVS